MKYNKREGKLFIIIKEVKEVIKELNQILPYTNKETHNRIKAIIWKLTFIIKTERKKIHE